VDIGDVFAGAFKRLASDECLCAENGGWRLTRNGMLQADALLPEFFEPEHRGIRYT
jgi:oxygen-independent coproporphyrinogen-3 oxidase